MHEGLGDGSVGLELGVFARAHKHPLDPPARLRLQVRSRQFTHRLRPGRREEQGLALSGERREDLI